MKTRAETVEWSQRYQRALRRYLFQDLIPRLQPALKLGCQAAVLGMETLKLAQIHEQVLMAIVPSGSTAGARKRVTAQAKNFFDETNSAIEKTHVAALKKEGRVTHLTQRLLSRTAESKASLLRLKHGILQRKKAEAELVKSGSDHAKLLKRSNRLHALLRNQTHSMLTHQEKTRKKASLGLQDKMAQALLGIHIELLALKVSDKARNERFSKEIDSLKRSVRLEPKD